MKILKRLGFVLLLLIVGVVILNLITSSIAIEQEIEINASSEQVFEVLKSYEQFPNWSPFLVADPNQKNWVTGEDGKLGSKFHWEGAEEESKGYQELVRLKQSELLVMQCTISVPFESSPIFRYELLENSSITIVKQTFEMPASLFDKVLMNAIGVVEEIESTNQLGLSRLKSYVESNQVAS